MEQQPQRRRESGVEDPCVKQTTGWRVGPFWLMIAFLLGLACGAGDAEAQEGRPWDEDDQLELVADIAAWNPVCRPPVDMAAIQRLTDDTLVVAEAMDRRLGKAEAERRLVAHMEEGQRRREAHRGFDTTEACALLVDRMRDRGYLATRR